MVLIDFLFKTFRMGFKKSLPSSNFASLYFDDIIEIK